ncbi:hypothetical protein [Pectinatus brassicae]|nr:hypothetical protein [Pectinatus brassicae]
MADILLEQLKKLAMDYIEVQQERLDEFYIMAINKAVDMLKENIKEQFADYYVSLLTALEGNIDIAVLLKIKEELNS